MMAICGHQRPAGHPGYISCASDAIVQDYVESQFCERCPFHTEHGRLRTKQPRRIRGLGDVVAKAAAAVNVKKKKGCGCGSRQAWLNRVIPFGRRAADKRWSVIVTAAPRTEATLAPCVYSLRQAGWEPVVFAEPDTDTLEDVETKFAPQRLGVWHNWVRAVRWALSTPAELILTVQDDTVVHPDSKQFVEGVLWPSPNCGFVSLYTPKHYSKTKQGEKPPGVNRIHTGSLWGACALVWPRPVLERLLDHEFARNWLGAAPRSRSRAVMDKRRSDPTLVQNSDTAIGKILSYSRREMWFVDPSPAVHIATKSTIGHGGNEGRRNCGRCADFSRPLADQVPAPEGKHAIA